MPPALAEVGILELPVHVIVVAETYCEDDP
jgi:hypothetical protein